MGRRRHRLRAGVVEPHAGGPFVEHAVGVRGDRGHVRYGTGVHCLLQHLVDAGSFNVPRYGTSVGSDLVADARQACGTPSDDGPECGRDHTSW